MREEGLRDVQGDAAEEDAEHGDPAEVLEDCEYRAEVSFARFGLERWAFTYVIGRESSLLRGSASLPGIRCPEQ